jgi:Rrf2 family protein
MKFSTKSEYGLRALTHLDGTGQNPVSLALIAKRENLSLAYLERLFSQLKKGNIVKADVGVKGGYYLARPAEDISVLEVLEALEGSLAPFSCASGGTSVTCACSVQPVWIALYAQMRKTLKKLKLSEIIGRRVK